MAVAHGIISAIVQQPRARDAAVLTGPILITGALGKGLIADAIHALAFAESTVEAAGAAGAGITTPETVCGAQ